MWGPTNGKEGDQDFEKNNYDSDDWLKLSIFDIHIIHHIVQFCIIYMYIPIFIFCITYK